MKISEVVCDFVDVAHQSMESYKTPRSERLSPLTAPDVSLSIFVVIMDLSTSVSYFMNCSFYDLVNKASVNHGMYLVGPYLTLIGLCGNILLSFFLSLIWLKQF